MLRQLRDRLEAAPLPLRILVCAALLKFLCAGVYLSWFTNGADFAVMHAAGARAASGQGAHVYDEFLAFRPDSDSTLFFMYPPPVAVFYAALGRLPFRTALALFESLAQAGLLAAFLIWARHRKLEPLSEKYCLAFALVFLFFPLDYAFQLGQNEAVVLLLLVLALSWHGRGRLLAAGLALAAAICLKVFLAFLLFYLLLQRRWRLLAWTTLALAALAGLSLAAVPWAVQAQYYGRLGRDLGIEAFYDNQSLTGLFYRALTYSGYTRGFLDDPGLARLSTRLASLLLVSGFSAAVWKRREEGAFDEGFGLALTTALLLSPHSDTHHQALLLVSFLLLLERPRVPGAVLLYYGFFAAFAPVISFRFLDPDRLRSFASGAGSFVYSIPVLVLLGFWLHCARTKAPVPAPSGPRLRRTA